MKRWLRSAPLERLVNLEAQMRWSGDMLGLVGLGTLYCANERKSSIVKRTFDTFDEVSHCCMSYKQTHSPEKKEQIQYISIIDIVIIFPEQGRAIMNSD